MDLSKKEPITFVYQRIDCKTTNVRVARKTTIPLGAQKTLIVGTDREVLAMID